MFKQSNFSNKRKKMIYFRRIPKSTKIILLYAHVFIFSCVLFIYKRHQTLYSEDGYLDLDHRNKLAAMQNYVQLDREQFNSTFNPHIYKVFQIEGEDVIVYKHNYTASLSRFDVGKANIKFLEHFKTPCFLEEVVNEDNVYRENKLISTLSYFKRDCFFSGIMSGNASNITLPGYSEKFRLRCLPYFMVLGVAKSGTTDFAFRMIKNPLVLKGMSKELYWWNQYRVVLNSSLSDYSDMLDTGVTEMLKMEDKNYGTDTYYQSVIGEMTSITLVDFPHWREDRRNSGLDQPKYLIPHDVYNLNPNVKLIVLFRNPVTRIYSQYNMFRYKTKSPENFHTLVVNSISWWESCVERLPVRNCLYGSPPEMSPVEHNLSVWWPPSHNYTGCIREGLYYMYLLDWFSVFPRSSFLFIRSEDYTHNQLSVMNEAYKFLGVPTAKSNVVSWIENMDKVFVLKYEPMLEETQKLLADFYGGYNSKLAELLGDERWLWRTS